MGMSSELYNGIGELLWISVGTWASLLPWRLG